MSSTEGVKALIAVAMSSADDHDALPEPRTLVREKDGVRADLMVPRDYPMLATCVCGMPIRSQSFFVLSGKSWVHVSGTEGPADAT